MNRSQCVLCEGSLSELFVLRQYPITITYGTHNISNDEFADSIHTSCEQCGNIQLSSLIDPEKLYKDSHNSTNHSPVWTEHHRAFSEFIIKYADTENILEIGGNTCVLYQHLKDAFKSYSILDICDSEKRSSAVKYIQGDCESFDFTDISSVVMSHTFEHLYNPKRFIQRISYAPVRSVFISIPNMDYMYTNNNLHVLSNEHTFFVGDNEIRYLFSKGGYICTESFTFKEHSYFYKFVYNTHTTPLILYNSIKRSNDIKRITLDFESYLDTISISTPFFICPAGGYGQKVYYYLNRRLISAMGFIDNDVNKQAKRLCGTSIDIYSPNILLDCMNTEVCVVLCGAMYTNEIQAQLRKIHPNIKFIHIRGF